MISAFSTQTLFVFQVPKICRVRFGYLGAPYLYRTLIIDLVLDNTKLTSCMARAGRLYSIDIYICVIMIMFIYELLSNGMKNNSKDQTTSALLVFIFFIVSMLRIYFYKVSPDRDYAEVLGCDEIPEGEEPHESKSSQYIVDNIQQLLLQEARVDGDTDHSRQF